MYKSSRATPGTSASLIIIRFILISLFLSRLLFRMLINAMEVTGIEGTYRSTCESTMEVGIQLSLVGNSPRTNQGEILFEFNHLLVHKSIIFKFTELSF